MSNIKISEMAEAESLNDNDLLTIVQSGINKKITKQNAIGDIIQAINNPTYTATEGTDLSINNTRVGKMKFEYYGDTEQDTTTGENKFDGSQISATQVYQCSVSTSDEITTISSSATSGVAFARFLPTMTLTPNTQYTLSFDVTGDYDHSRIYDVTGSSYIDLTTTTTSGRASGTFTTSANSSFQLMTYVVINKSCTISKIQVAQGTNSTYEPYTGGTASPNPSYPQEVKTVTGENTINVVGKNLFDKNSAIGGWVRASNGLVVDQFQDTYCYTPFFKVSPNTTYTCNLYNQTGLGSGGICEYSSTNDTSFIQATAETQQIITITTSATTNYIRFTARQDSKDYVQFEKGSTATTYEQYQGQSYELNLGKNLLPNIANPVTITGITFNVNADKSITINGTATADVSLKITDYLNFTNNNYFLSGCPTGGSNNTYSMVLEGTGRDTGNGVAFTSATNKRVAIEIKNGVSVTNLVFKPMIEKGSQATSYAPYFTPIELCKIGDYQDYIYNNGGKWFKHKEIEKAVIDGSGDWSITGTNPFYRYRYLTDALYIANELNIFCNQFVYKFINATNENIGISISSTQELRIRETSMKSIDDWTTWLSTNNLIIYYVLATPTDTEITDTTLINQLNAIKHGAESYYGQTNIMITSEEMQPILKVQTLDKIGV